MTRDPKDVLDFDRLRAAPVADVPFPFLTVTHVIRGATKRAITEDFPEVSKAGSFPLPSLDYGPAFEALIAALTGPEMTQIIEEKFGIDLKGRPTMATVRGRCEARDGQIHTDSKTKLITMLLYMNDHADADRGRLRLLRSPSDLDDMAYEVPADEATLLVFRNTPNAWHGFEPFSGPRRVIQVNWVTDDSVVRREQARHRVSAFFKRLVGKSARHAAAY
ncbi:MAG TPA: 2OG-Fe(II) oxygenase [Rhizomicrobium sp.]|nr:2OG-Fe(II) oxygenase [Rhizomicrobium sp.]